MEFNNTQGVKCLGEKHQLVFRVQKKKRRRLSPTARPDRGTRAARVKSRGEGKEVFQGLG